MECTINQMSGYLMSIIGLSAVSDAFGCQLSVERGLVYYICYLIYAKSNSVEQRAYIRVTTYITVNSEIRTQSVVYILLLKRQDM